MVFKLVAHFRGVGFGTYVGKKNIKVILLKKNEGLIIALRVYLIQSMCYFNSSIILL